LNLVLYMFNSTFFFKYKLTSKKNIFINFFTKIKYLLTKIKYNKNVKINNLTPGEFKSNNLTLKKKLTKFFFLKKFTVNQFYSNIFKYVYLYIFFNNKNYFTKNNFRFFYKKANTPFYKNSFLKTFVSGFNYIWLGLRFWLIPVLFLFIFIIFLIFYKSIPVYKFSFMIFIITSFIYWLMSGFTFFIKKYRYRYFTSAIQRFWKRSFAIFWMLEFFLITIFIYLTLMSSQEPFFMFDNSQIFKTHLFSWKLFFLKIIPTIIIIVLTYFSIILIKWVSFSKANNVMILITSFLFFLVWVEFYQFFHILSFYGNLNWKYDEDDNFWFLENEFKRTRIVNHFLTICLVAKFWHIVFVAVFWLFFLLRGLELNKIRHPLLVSNFQNFIFIYILSWFYMFPWFKYFFLKIFNVPYFWFYVNNKNLFFFFFLTTLYFFIKIFYEKLH